MNITSRLQETVGSLWGKRTFRKLCLEKALIGSETELNNEKSSVKFMIVAMRRKTEFAHKINA